MIFETCLMGHVGTGRSGLRGRGRGSRRCGVRHTGPRRELGAVRGGRAPVTVRARMTHDPDAFDYVVLGGGSAGCVLAGRLSEDPSLRVLLLETGDRAERHPETLRADGYKDAFVN